MDRPPHFPHSRPGNPARPLLWGILECPPRNRISARDLHRGPAGGRSVRSSATRQSPACGPPEIVGTPHPPRLRGRSVPLSLGRTDARRGFHPSGPDSIDDSVSRMGKVPASIRKKIMKKNAGCRKYNYRGSPRSRRAIPADRGLQGRQWETAQARGSRESSVFFP